MAIVIWSVVGLAFLGHLLFAYALCQAASDRVRS